MAANSSSRTPILVIAAVVLLGGLGGLLWLLLDEGPGAADTGDVVRSESSDLALGTDLDPQDGRPDRAPVEELGAADRDAEVESIARQTFGETGTIVGRVVDDEIPVSEAEITLYKGNPHVHAAWTTLRDRVEGISTVTASDGSFSLSHVPVGEPYVVVASHGDFARSEAGGIRVRKGEATTGVIVRMTKGAVISGLVKDKETESPIAGARAELYHSLELALRPESRERPWRVVFTDETGRFAFPFVSEPSIRIAISADGFESQSRGVNFSLEGKARDRMDIHFSLGVGLDLSGRVEDEEGTGVVNAAVTATALTKSFQGESVAFTDSAGYFLLEGLGDHSYNLRAEADGFSTKSVPKVTPHQQGVVLTLERQGAVSGTVTDYDGNPIPSFSLHLMRSMAGRAPGFLNVVQRFDSSDGSFVFEGLDPASYLLEARAKGWANARSAEFTIRRNDPAPPEVTILMGRGGTVHGVITDGDGKAVNGALVSVRDNNYVDNAISRIFGQIAPRGASEPQDTTDKQGRFEIGHVPAGVYQVAVNHPAWAPRVVNDVNVVDDSQGYNGPVDVILPKGAVIAGLALDEASQPMAFVSVQISMPGSGYMDKTTTDSDGAFRFDNLEEGTYKVVLSPERDPSGRQLNPIMMLVYSQKSAQEVHVRAGQVIDDMTLYFQRS